MLHSLLDEQVLAMMPSPEQPSSISTSAARAKAAKGSLAMFITRSEHACPDRAMQSLSDCLQLKISWNCWELPPGTYYRLRHGSIFGS